MDEKVRSWVKECFYMLEWCEKTNFAYFEKFHTLHTLRTLRWKEKSLNSLTILSTLAKLIQTLTLTLFSCSPKPNCENED